MKVSHQALPLAWLPLLCLLPMEVDGQTQLELSVVSGGAGRFDNGDIQIAATLGQHVVQTATGSAVTLVSGFGQNPALLHAPELAAFAGATLSNDRPILSWNGVYGGATYELSYADNNGFEDAAIVTGIAGTQYTVSSGLASGTHYWRVRSLGVNSQSAFSAADHFDIAAPGS